MKSEYIEKNFSAFRIGKQGSWDSIGFNFRARQDCQECRIGQDWIAENITDNNALAQTLMLRFLDSYLREATLSENKNNIELNLNIALEIIFNILNKTENLKLSWDGMVAGNRLLRLLFIRYKILENAESLITDINLNELNKQIEIIIKRLSSINLPKNNHGLQAMHSLVAAGIFTKRNDLLNRFTDETYLTFSSLFNDEGFWLENSSEYHFYAIQLLDEFTSLDWYENTKIVDIREKAHNISKLLFAGDNGESFVFGDSDRSLTKTKFKKIKPKPIITFPSELTLKEKSGFCVSRINENGINSSLCAINFYNGDFHNHHDYMSFEWFYKDHWIIIDPGKFTYNQGKEKTYSLSDHSHNTISLMGIGHNPKKSFKTIAASNHTKANTITMSIHDDSFCATRFIRHNHNKVEVHDTILINGINKNKSIENIKSSLNISPEFKKSEESSEILTYTKDTSKIEVITKQPSTTWCGSIEPYLGWHGEKYNVIKPNSIIVLSPIELNDRCISIEFKYTITVNI